MGLPFSTETRWQYSVSRYMKSRWKKIACFALCSVKLNCTKLQISNEIKLKMLLLPKWIISINKSGFIWKTFSCIISSLIKLLGFIKFTYNNKTQACAIFIHNRTAAVPYRCIVSVNELEVTKVSKVRRKFILRWI